MFGHQLMIPIPDVNRTAHMVIIGGNLRPQWQPYDRPQHGQEAQEDS